MYRNKHIGITYATVINIPTDYSTIQEGIQNSVNGDTVLVQPGIYTETVDFEGRSIVVGSLYISTFDTSYISQTIIDGNHSGRCVNFYTNEDSEAILIGLTIRNGHSNFGSGIFISNSDPTLENLVIRNNSATLGAGILMADHSNPTIINSTIINNITEDSGGGLYCGENSNPLIDGLLIEGNSAEWGGRIFCDHASPTISNSIITGNTAIRGGGIWLQNESNPIITYSDMSMGTLNYTGRGHFQNAPPNSCLN